MPGGETPQEGVAPAPTEAPRGGAAGGQLEAAQAAPPTGLRGGAVGAVAGTRGGGRGARVSEALEQPRGRRRA
eukprot:7386896-Prymnesium_polylepis.1